MSKTVQTFLFVIVLGLFVSILLTGMDLFTAERIEANEAALLQSTILEGHDIEYTLNEANEIFEQTLDTVEIDGYTFYVNNDTGSISFYFEGGGVWGPITGIITLNQDFETIEDVAILAQEETPGLGGVVAEQWYLDQFDGKIMTPNLDIIKGASSLNDNQVDSITGATRTSDAFETILNNAYETHKNLWDNR